MVEEGQDWKDVAIPAAGGAAKPAPAAVADTPAAAAAVASSGTVSVASDHPFVHPSQVGPATALLMSQFNIKPENITGSGPKGNIVKADVKKYIKENNLSAVVHSVPLPQAAAKPASAQAATSKSSAAKPAPRPRSGYTDVELTNMRKVIAKRLTESKQTAPHGYSSATAVIDNVSRLRKDYIASGYKVSINDFVIKVGGVISNIEFLFLYTNFLSRMSYYDFSHFAPSIGGLCYWRVGKEVDKWTKSIPLIKCQMKYLEKDKIFLNFFCLLK